MLPIIFSIIFALILTGTTVYMVVVFNNLQLLKVNIEKATANLDVLFKQRFEEIPQLIAVCKSYIKYETESFEKLITLIKNYEVSKTESCTATSSTSTQEINETNTLNNQVTQELKGLESQIALSYPELKASPQFQNIQHRISSLENQISDRREFINESVALYNTRLHSLPDVFLAKILNLKDKEMFSAAEPEREVPKIEIV